MLLCSPFTPSLVLLRETGAGILALPFHPLTPLAIEGTGPLWLGTGSHAR